VHEVVSWWRVWEHIKVSTRYVSPFRIALQISNTGYRSARDVIVYANFPTAHRITHFEPMTIGTPQLKGSTENGRFWKLYLKGIGPGKTHVYYIDSSKDTPPLPAAPAGAPAQASASRKGPDPS